MKSIDDIINNSEQNTVNEDLDIQYDKIINILKEAKENNTPIDEGLFGAIFGGLSGAVAGPAIGKAICKAMSIDERGMLGNLFTSRLFLTALGGYIGWKN